MKTQAVNITISEPVCYYGTTVILEKQQHLRLISSVSHCGLPDHIEQDFPHALNVVLAHNVTFVTSAFHIPPLEGC